MWERPQDGARCLHRSDLEPQAEQLGPHWLWAMHSRSLSKAWRPTSQTAADIISTDGRLSCRDVKPALRCTKIIYFTLWFKVLGPLQDVPFKLLCMKLEKLPMLLLRLWTFLGTCYFFKSWGRSASTGRVNSCWFLMLLYICYINKADTTCSSINISLNRNQGVC